MTLLFVRYLRRLSYFNVESPLDTALRTEQYAGCECSPFELFTTSRNPAMLADMKMEKVRMRLVQIWSHLICISFLASSRHQEEIAL